MSETAERIFVAAPERVEEADDDAVLVRQVQAGDVAAFDRLIVKYRERLYSIIYNLSGNREDTSDLTQEVFIKSFQAIHRFRGQSSFFTWIYRIAVNHTLSHLKKNRYRRFFSFDNLEESPESSELVEALTAESNQDRESLLHELQQKLNEALQSLSLKHRTVVVLYEIEGLSHQEIAEVMNCSVGTVRSRLHYAKQQLQALLQDYIQ